MGIKTSKRRFTKERNGLIAPTICNPTRITTTKIYGPDKCINALARFSVPIAAQSKNKPTPHASKLTNKRYLSIFTSDSPFEILKVKEIIQSREESVLINVYVFPSFLNGLNNYEICDKDAGKDFSYSTNFLSKSLMISGVNSCLNCSFVDHL